MLIVTVFGVKMAARTRMMASVLTKANCVRGETLPEMRVLQKRPTIISSQYTAATAPPTAAPFKAMPASLLTTLSASAKVTTHGAATKLAASAAKKGTGIIMKKVLIGSVIAVVSVGSIAGVTLGVMKLKDDKKPRRVREEREEEEDDEEENIIEETEGEEGVLSDDVKRSLKSLKYDVSTGLLVTFKLSNLLSCLCCCMDIC